MGVDNEAWAQRSETVMGGSSSASWTGPIIGRQVARFRSIFAPDRPRNQAPIQQLKSKTAIITRNTGRKTRLRTSRPGRYGFGLFDQVLINSLRLRTPSACGTVPSPRRKAQGGGVTISRWLRYLFGSGLFFARLQLDRGRRRLRCVTPTSLFISDPAKLLEHGGGIKS